MLKLIGDKLDLIGTSAQKMFLATTLVARTLNLLDGNTVMYVV